MDHTFLILLVELLSFPMKNLRNPTEGIRGQYNSGVLEPPNPASSPVLSPFGPFLSLIINRLLGFWKSFYLKNRNQFFRNKKENSSSIPVYMIEYHFTILLVLFR